MTNTEQRLTALEKLLFETDQYRNSGGELPYKVYTALLTQSGTNAPVATVLENTLGGTVTFGRINAENYTINCTDCFAENKTFISISNYKWLEEGQNYFIIASWRDTDTISIFGHSPEVSSSILDGILTRPLYIEIRVYQ